MKKRNKWIFPSVLFDIFEEYSEYDTTCIGIWNKRINTNEIKEYECANNKMSTK